MSRRDPMVLMRHMVDFAREACEMAEGHLRESLDTDRQLSLSLTRRPATSALTHRIPRS